MSTSYAPSLPTPKDWVRFLIGDRSAPFALQDEEIEAVVADEANTYLAAARCAELVQGLGKGVVRKRVGTLALEFSDSPDNAYQRLIDELRQTGAERLQGASRVTFTVL